MRISRGRGWLAVLVLTLGTANGDHVNFATGFVPLENIKAGTNTAVIDLKDAPRRNFTWSSDVVVDEVVLYKFQLNSSGAETDTRLGSGKRRGDPPAQLTGDMDTFATRTPTRPFIDQPTIIADTLGRRSPEGNFGIQMSDERLIVYSNQTGGQVFFGDDVSWIALGVSLFFEAKWNNGSSYSRAFTLGQAVPVSDVYNNPNPHHNETGTPASNNDQISSSTSTVAQAPSGGAGQEATPTGNGLSSGAVIGIAVACGVVGLLLVFALVWYLLRRRQQKKAMGGHPVDSAYGPGNRRADELMAEKEAAADVDVAPHSPYSDEGGSGSAAGPSGGAYPDGSGSGAAHGEAVAAGAATAGSFTPYSDRPGAAAPSVAAGTPSLHAASVVQTDEPHVSVPSATPGRATPRALTTPYAHLVEEGMTEEEIRRLEEEERQLDAAIEQAGRR